MNRWLWFSLCAILGLAMLACGLLVPIHLRAVDSSVVQLAGRGSPSLIERGAALVREKQLGGAQLLLQAAQNEGVPEAEKLGFDVGILATEHPAFRVWGGSEPRLELLFGAETTQTNPAAEPFTEFLIRQSNRGRVLELLQASTSPAVQELLRCRALTNTVIFPPSQSSSGQAFDAALSGCGLLLDEGRLAPGFSNAVFTLASQANRGGNTQSLEQALLDLMSLGQRFNWGQLEVFVAQVQDPETLRWLTHFVRQAEGELPVLFAAVNLSGEPAGVAKYLRTFSESGLKDLGASLRLGAGGVTELLLRNQRLHSSSLPDLGLDYCLRTPRIALTIKWILYLAGGFFLAAALHFARPAVSALERPLQVRGFHIAREGLFALGFLLVVLLLSEPFLAQESQKVEFPFRLRLSTVGSVVPVGTTSVKPSFMNPKSLLTLLLFFVLQGLIYISCLVKLAEIRRQQVPARIKLKLLENEEHLFDAGLYLGFAGTIISLILVSLNIIQPSLMAAYSSTSFGIIFVSVFKIFHLRPLRRKLLLEAEVPAGQPAAPMTARVFATSP